MKYKEIVLVAFILILGFFVMFFAHKMVYPNLNFSDTTKYADVARNILNGSGYGSTFKFFAGLKVEDFSKTIYPSPSILPVYPFLLSIVFRIFGTSDASIVSLSMIVNLLTAVSVYFLSKKIFNSKLTGLLSTVAFIFSPIFINYTLSGASEMIFVFELVILFLCLSQKKKYKYFLSAIFMILMYYTRPQAVIFIFPALLYGLLSDYSFNKAIGVFFVSTLVFLAFDYLVLSTISGRYMTYSILFSGKEAVVGSLTSGSQSDYLRGQDYIFSISEVSKKIFYNLYNFYKALPQIMNPYLLALFIIGLFVRSKDKIKNSFKVSVLFTVFIIFLTAALTIPFYRYLHPVVPIVYIVAVGTLVDLFKDSKLKVYITSLLVIIFTVGQTLGIIFLDSRFEKSTHNVDKSPIYVQMSLKLKDITDKDDTILTNLDTWGSWYGERKTIWFPLEPSMILGKESEIKYIYLTSYKIDDENYYMGENWREIFMKPDTQKILSHYKFVSEYRFNAQENYERENGRAVLLERIK